MFGSTNKNKEALKNYLKLWKETKRKIEVINNDEPIEYKKDFIKIKFESDDDLSLGKTFNIADIIIVVASVLEKNGKYYPKHLLDECAYKLKECYSTKKFIFHKELTLIKQVYQKNVCFVIKGTLKMLDLNLNHMFVINVTMY